MQEVNQVSNKPIHRFSHTNQPAPGRAGRKKGSLSIIGETKRFLEGYDLKTKKMRLRIINEAQFDKARKGDTRAAEFLVIRAYGQPKEQISIQHSGEIKQSWSIIRYSDLISSQPVEKLLITDSCQQMPNSCANDNNKGSNDIK